MNAIINPPVWYDLCAQQNTHFSQYSWLTQFRQTALEKFHQRGMPSRKEEAWKYTVVAQLEKLSNTIARSVDAAVEQSLTGMINTHGVFNKHLLVFINGFFSAGLSRIAALPAGVILCSIGEALTQHTTAVKSLLLKEYDGKRHPFAQLNSALLSDGLFLHVPANQHIHESVHVLFINTQSDAAISPRNLIVAEKNSAVTIIEEHVSYQAENYFSNIVTDMQVEDNAQVRYVKLQDESFSATHIANLFIQQKKDSMVKTAVFTRGGQLSRDDLTVAQLENGAESLLSGYYFLHQQGQHMDHHIHVDHMAAHGTSSMLYKGILDKKSTAVFNGKVYVYPTAKQINAHQANHNLLLCPDAEVNTKPELEIYNDDVRCTHGATVGQLNAESLFYLRARGIPHQDALRILTQGFAEEIFNQIDHAAIHDYIKQRMKNHDEL